MHSRLWHALAATAALLASTVATAVAAPQTPAGDTGDHVPIAGSTPAWATPHTEVARTNGSTVRHIQVALALRDQPGAERLAAQLATPGRAEHGKFLSSREFLDRFAPTQDAVDQVSRWLAKQGLHVTGVSPNRHFVDAEAPTAALESAFGTRIAAFRARIDGVTRTLTAPASPVTVPISLRASITAVLGLDDSAALLKPQHTRPAAVAAEQHCARWWGEQNNTDVPQKYPAGFQSNALCGYTGTQVRAMYKLNNGNTGAGTTIGVVGAYNSDTIVADTNQASSQLGVPPLAEGQYSAVLPEGGFTDATECGAEGWAAEQTLDVQASHTIAPAAKIRYYAGKTCKGTGIYEAFNLAVADNAVDVISNSYGNADGENSLPQMARDQFNAMALQAAIQGQTVTVSTGDAGNNSGPVGRPTVSFPSSSPWVVAVGGTSVGLDQNNQPTVLTGWENSGNTQSGSSWAPQQDADGPFASGAGGGSSALYCMPNWQMGVVPGSGEKRGVPDIAALADSYTGMLVGQTIKGQFGIGSYGGTSLASPLIAGLVADAQQARSGNARAGMLTPILYSLAGSSAIADVTPQKAGVWTPMMHAFGGVAVPGGQGSYLIDFDARPQNLQSGPGWDNVTGLGTPADGFIGALSQ
ncbi:S53 family serine peptidase [Amycolatopsis sp. DG1A-15b]|uniref:S53 family peptidase n=1 Tax=Amycolatopsis sp. DG1A-15b TaxID=3052846 RepID=UPI00255C0154|nr:S53 family serine peptidase [Amycolatopsis sp. DG1A-15b]WIX85815.1 S53 family serine peptidase [Amycolatopsis sp. DG1A-15b]